MKHPSRTSDTQKPNRSLSSNNIPEKVKDDGDSESRLSDFLAKGTLSSSPPRADESVTSGRISVTRSSTGDRNSPPRAEESVTGARRSAARSPRPSTGDRGQPASRSSPLQSSSDIHTRRPSASSSDGCRPSGSSTEAMNLLQQLRSRRKTPASITTNGPRIPPTITSAPVISSSPIQPLAPSPPPPTSASGGSRSGSKLDLLIDQIEGWDVEEEDEDWTDDQPEVGFRAELHRAVKPFYTEEEQPKRKSGPPAVILFSDIPKIAPPPPPPIAANTVKSKYVNLVPLSRANNISITLSRFTRVLKANGGGDGMHATSHTLLGAVLDLDTGLRFLD
jgi:hypothetical protein